MASVPTEKWSARMGMVKVSGCCACSARTPSRASGERRRVGSHAVVGSDVGDVEAADGAMEDESARDADEVEGITEKGFGALAEGVLLRVGGLMGCDFRDLNASLTCGVGAAATSISNSTSTLR